MKNRLSHRVSLLASALSLLGGTAGKALAADPIEVRVVQAARADVSRFVTLPGNIRPNQQATLYSKIPGYLKSISVDRGDKVIAGQALAEIEAPELEADLSRYAADLARAKAEAATAKLETDRLAKAAASSPDLVPAQTLDSSKGRLTTAEAGVVAAEAGLQRTKMLLGYSRLPAPFGGVVTARFVDAGAFIPAATAGSSAGNAAVLTLMDFSTVRVQVAVPESEASLVKVGQPVRVSVDGLPGKMFSGVISRHGYVLDESTRSLQCEADFPNSDMILRPGMYATVRVGVETHAGVWSVPSAAVLTEKAASSVFVVEGDKVKKIPVTIGFNDGARIEILKGIAEGASMAIAQKGFLGDGAPIKLVEAK